MILEEKILLIYIYVIKEDAMMPGTNILKQGDQAPDFVITASNGNEVSLADFLGQPVVLFFYTKNDAPDCVSLLCDFRDHFSELKRLGVRLLGISIETLDSQNKAISKHGIPFLLLCDKNMKISRLYGVYQSRVVAGAKVWGVERTTCILDQSGLIVKIFRNVKSPGHVEDVLEFLRAMPGTDRNI